MACPRCGKIYCGHSPGERGQNEEEVRAVFSEDLAHRDDSEYKKARKILLAKKSAGFAQAAKIVGRELAAQALLDILREECATKHIERKPGSLQIFVNRIQNDISEKRT